MLAIGAPQSWPTTTAGSSLSASITAATSPASSRKVYRSISRGFDEPPYPRTLSAAARNPRAATWSIWWRHEYQSSGQPWTNTINGPAPFVATSIEKSPFVTVMNSTSVIEPASQTLHPGSDPGCNIAYGRIS